MRFRRIDLTRFGIFTDQSLQLPRLASDLHIIVGPNEAGKSTTRTAVGDFLFGIGMRTSYDFLHDYRTLCIGAVVENGRGAIELRRRKGTKNTLSDTADSPVPDERLSALLGGADREFYERMFSLDHTALVQGGQNILNAEDDVGRMLFESASGIGGLADVRDSLETEAAGLWSQRKNQKAAYHRASEALKDAQRRISDAAIRVPAWTQLRKTYETAESELAEIVEECSRLEQERTRLERLHRVAPLLARRAQKIKERSELGAAPVLPPGAHGILEAPERELGGLEIAIARHQEAIEGCTARASITIDIALLARREEVERLVADGNRFSQHGSDIAKRRVELEGLLSDVASLALSLGYGETDPEALRGKLPPAILRSSLSSLAPRRAVLDEKLRNETKRLAEQQRQIDALANELAQAPPSEVPPALIGALASASALGEVTTRRSELREACEAAMSRCDREIRQLAPWNGTIAELATIVVPDATRLRQVHSDRETRRAALEAARRSLAEATRALDAKAIEAAALQRATQAVSAAELEGARRRRDDAWGAIRPRFVSGLHEGSADERSARAQVLDTAIELADQTADRKVQGAAESARLEHAFASREEHDARVRAAAAHVDEIVNELTELDREWAELLAPLALAALDHAEVLAWQQHRTLALAARDAAVNAEKLLDVLAQDEAKAAEALCVALLQAGRSSDDTKGQALPGLIAMARAIERSVSESVGKRRRDEDSLAELRKTLPAIESGLRSLKEEIQGWETQWAGVLAAAGLPVQTSPDIIDQALGWFRDLDEQLKSIDAIRVQRIQKMEIDLREFAKRAHELTTAVAADLAGRDPFEVASILRGRLESATADDGKRREALVERERKQNALNDALAEHERLEASLSPLKQATGASSLTELRQALALCDRAHALDEEIREATDQAIRAGEGRGLQELEGEDAADDRDTRTIRIESLRGQLEAAQSRRQAAAMKLSEAKTALNAVTGQEDAAAAAGERESALADMRDAIERYVKVRVASRLLGWAVERYRREKQGPLLRRASELFSILTLGGFERLEVDEDDGKPQVLAVRSDEKRVGVDGMSTGARDQLYLALRIAALEAHMEKATPLPVIVDDVLINFDDERAAAGLRVLAELATETQVLLFTHHRHLVDVARATLGERVGVVELGGH